MKVYLDMDRVIADFDNGVREYAHIEPPDQKNEEQVTEMWKKLSKVPHYYDKHDLMPGAESGVAALFEMFGEDLEILTGVPNPTRGLPTASDDKKLDEKEVRAANCRKYSAARRKENLLHRKRLYPDR